MKKIEGGITAAKGFQAAGGAAGIKKQGVKDMALVYSEVPCVAAGTFTTNIVKAAPVKCFCFGVMPPSAMLGRS